MPVDIVATDAMTRNGAAGVIYQVGNKVLLMKRAPTAAAHPGVWGLPAGGIDDGETAEQACEREFREETGGTLTDKLTLMNELNGFALFRAQGQEFTPTLNDEHSEFMWADADNMPSPLHPNLAAQLDQCARADAMDWSESSRERTQNGYVTVNRNPITRVGVFKYSGRVIPGADPSRMYNVLRPAEELSRQETLDSMKMLPIYDEHEMTGDGYPTAPEEKGIHGSTGQDVAFEGDDVLAPLRIFSRSMRRNLDFKKGLSLGYKCRYEKSAGQFRGMPYDYIQRDILADHLAVVREGRVGTEVLDHNDTSFVFDHIEIALDETEETKMADESTEKKDDVKADAEGSEKKGEPTIAECYAMMEKLMPLLEIADKMKAGSGAESETLDEDDESKKDEKKDEKKEEKGEAMDAAERTALNNRITALEAQVNKSNAIGSKDKHALVSKVTPLVGTFDSAEMDADGVAKYAVEKLGITGVKAGHEVSAVNAYLSAHKPANAFAMDSVAHAPKKGGLLAKRVGPSA